MIGISKRKRNGKDNQKESSSKTSKTIFPKPKILLIDLPKDVSEGLKSKGFNVNYGTFGAPFKVDISRDAVYLIGPPNLPNLTEQEIIIIDLTPPPLKKTSMDLVKTEENQWWARCSSGSIDPRFVHMFYNRKHFDRILNHGGFFVIFAQPRIEEEYIWGKDEEGYGIIGDTEKHDNWSFLLF